MIVVITTAAHRSTHRSLLEERPERTQVVSYGELFGHASRLPPATYVFTDADRLSASQLGKAADLARQLHELGQRVLNDPARVRSRFGLLRALNRAGINAFDAYRAEDFDQPRQWPVFIRVEGKHAAPVSGLLHSQAELDGEIERLVGEGVPRSTLLIVEYAAEPVRPGLFRKLAAFRVGEQLLGYTCVHDDQWIVKYGKSGIGTPDLYEEEHRFVRECPYPEVLRSVFDIAGVDYGRVDYGIVAGRPQIYEINTNPDLKLRPEPSPVELRDRSNELFRENFLAALEAIDTGGHSIMEEGANAGAG